MKYFVITDVHSFYKPMMEALNKAGFDKDNPDHTLVSCGDLFDRGPDSKEVLEFVMSCPRRRLVQGNHESMLMDLLYGVRRPSYSDTHNGTIKTIEDLTGLSTKNGALRVLREDPLFKQYLDELVNYFETEHYIFVHSWLPDRLVKKDGFFVTTYGDYKNASYDEWEMARWGNPFEKWMTMQRSHENLGKTVVFGHWHTSYGHCWLHGEGKEFPVKKDNYKKECNFGPFYEDGIIGLDACTALTGMCNCLVVEDCE